MKNNRTYFLKTYGCQMNEADSEMIAAVLQTAGYQRLNEESEADLIILNTCSVRQSAQDRALSRLKKYSTLGRAARRGDNDEPRIILFGCLVNECQKDFRNKAPMVDHFVKPGDFETLAKVVSAKQTEAVFAAGTRPLRQSKFQALVPVMEGCDNFCAYCIVPYARGRERSRNYAEVIEEIEELAADGYKEVTLLGQNVNSYDGGISFPELLRRINEIDGSFRVFFLTSHPKDMSDDLLRVVADSEKLMPYIHLPVQAGSDEVLKRMGRGYSRNEYRALAKKVRALVPGAILSTDIIVGFPGETRGQFEDSKRIFEEVRYDMAYINKYSPRPGTAAARLDDNISDREKRRREKELTEILGRTALEHNKALVGRKARVLVEREEPRATGMNGSWLFGRTDGMKPVMIRLTGKKNARGLVGRFVFAVITRAWPYKLSGKL